MKRFRWSASAAILAMASATPAFAQVQADTQSADGATTRPGAAPGTEDAAAALAEGEEEIVVTGVRGAIREAVEIERRADTVVSVLTADDAGQFADQNVAESLQRIPGVTIVRTEGEGRFIQVRGLSSDFNQVVVNGAQIGSSDPDGGRSVALDIISSELLSGIQVAKTLTPDTDHDSLGAQVNLLTLSAYDRKGTSARLRGEIGMAEYASKISPRITGDFTTLLGDGDTFGIAAAFTYYKRHIQGEERRDNAGAVDRFANTNGTFGNVATPGSTRFLIPGIFDQRLEINERERIGGTVQFDFRPDDDNRFSATVIAGRLKDQDTRLQNEYEPQRTNARVAALGEGSVRLTNARLRRQIAFFDNTDRVIAGNVFGENKFGGWTASYGADYSKNRFTLPGGLRGRFGSADNLTVDFTYDENDAEASIIAGSIEPSAFPFNQLLIIDEQRTDEIYSGFGNLKKDFAIGEREASIKVGGKYRDRTKVIRRGERNIDPQSTTVSAAQPVSNRARLIAAGLPISLVGVNTSRPGNQDFTGFFEFPSQRDARALFDATLTLLDLQPLDTRRDFDFREKTLAGYIQGQIDFSPAVTLIGGVRVERTQFAATGLVVETIERNGTVVPQTAAAVPTTVNREYTEYFPSIHLRADITDQIVGRLSLSRAQVRPTFGDSRNFQAITTIQQTQGGALVTSERRLSGGNPLLESLIANQADATLAWYPSRATAFTAAGFYKDLKNPFISTTFRGEDVGFAGFDPLDPATGTGFSQAQTVGNAGSGSLLGVELGLSHLFSGPLTGFFINGNVTLIKGEVRSEFVRDNATLRLQDQASVIGNLSVGYEVERFTARVSGSYTGDRLQDVDSTNAEFDVIQDKYLTVDINLRFNFTPNFQIYTDVINLTNQEDIRYQRGLPGSQGIFERVADFGRTFQIGALVSF